MANKMKKNNSWKSSTDMKKYLESLKIDKEISFIDYEKKNSFSSGEAINHFKFGFGFVTKIINHSKVLIFFGEDDSEKVLLQNWSA